MLTPNNFEGTPIAVIPRGIDIRPAYDRRRTASGSFFSFSSSTPIALPAKGQLALLMGRLLNISEAP